MYGAGLRSTNAAPEEPAGQGGLRLLADGCLAPYDYFDQGSTRGRRGSYSDTGTGTGSAPASFLA